MALPKKQDFEEVFKLAQQTPCAFDILQFKESVQDDRSKVARLAKPLFQAMLKQDELLWKAVQARPAMVWLASEPGFRFAQKKVNRRASGAPNAPLSDDQLIDREVKRVMELSERYSEDSQFFSFFDYQVERYSSMLTWPVKVARAIYEYMFYDHDGRYAAQVEAERHIAKVYALLKKLEPFVIDEFSDHSIENVRIAIRQWESRAQKRQARNQRNKAEHLFARRMARINAAHSSKGTMKPDAIAELMTISVFQQRFDLRTLNRICSELAEEDKKVPGPDMVAFADLVAVEVMENAVKNDQRGASYKHRAR